MNALVLNDMDQTLTDEVLNQLAVEDVLSEELGHLSLNAIAGTDTSDCIKIRSLVNNKIMLILIDSGSSHSFVSACFVAKAGLPTTQVPPKRVKLPNGQTLISDKMVHQLEWWCQGKTLAVNMRILDLDAYDAILGYDWLKPHSPMNCHWENRTIEFQDLGRTSNFKDSNQGSWHFN
jgi:hypothetical protein